MTRPIQMESNFSFFNSFVVHHSSGFIHPNMGHPNLWPFCSHCCSPGLLLSLGTPIPIIKIMFKRNDFPNFENSQGKSSCSQSNGKRHSLSQPINQRAVTLGGRGAVKRLLRWPHLIHCGHSVECRRTGGLWHLKKIEASFNYQTRILCFGCSFLGCCRKIPPIPSSKIRLEPAKEEFNHHKTGIAIDR